VQEGAENMEIKTRLGAMKGFEISDLREGCFEFEIFAFVRCGMGVMGKI
jgi:hypothetical protein